MELPAGYAVILADLKDQIRKARIRAGLAVNRELVLLYWRIGRQILKDPYNFEFLTLGKAFLNK